MVTIHFLITVFQTPPRAWTSSSKGPSIPMKIMANRRAFTLLFLRPRTSPILFDCLR